MQELPVPGIRAVVDLWAEQTQDLGQRHEWVAVFENKGEIMGCSNPHPHGQIWACDFLPNEVEREEQSQAAYLQKNNSRLLADYARRESEA